MTKQSTSNLTDDQIIYLRQFGINAGYTSKQKDELHDYIKNNTAPCAVNYNLPGEIKNED